MENEAGASSISMTSMEMLAMGGFALFFAWMFIAFYWLFCEFPPDVPVQARDFTQFFVFLAVPAGYALMHVRGRNPQFNVFAMPVCVTTTAFAVAQPALALVMYLGLRVPLPVVCVFNFFAGAAAAAIKLSWLDVCSRIGADHYSRFTGLSLFAGGLLFSLVAFSPAILPPIFAILFIVLSSGFLQYSTKHVAGNSDCAPLESIENTWRFTLEIEPSFFMFGVVFGITFVYLFNSGSESVLVGLICTMVGSLAVAILSMADKQFGITVYQRFLVAVTIVACIAIPLVNDVGQLVCSCLVMASWAMFMAINSGYIVKKCVVAHESPLFRQAPIRLSIPALGFAVGWAVAAIITLRFGAHSSAFMYMRLVVAVLLVLTVMVFFPSQAHHPTDGLSPDEIKVTTTVIAADKSDKELFEARCAAVAKLYQLSPRETEILGYLAKGRNAAYIQDALTISPHTVKSHIYNIYRKLDIHSQQKLMDFVEEFPLD